MSSSMYKALAFVDETQAGDVGYLGRLDLQPRFGYVPQTLTLNLPQVRGVTYMRTARHGVDDSTRLMGARAIGMQVALLDEMTSLSEVELAEQLMAWMHPAKRPRLLLADGRSIVVRGEGVDSGWNFADLSFHVMNLSMIAPGGVIESAELHAAICGFGEVGGPPIGGRSYDLVFNRIYPAAVGGTAGASAVSCRNDGRITSYPTITFHGPVTNPEVHNGNTGAVMAFNLDLLANDVLTVDMNNHTVMFNGVKAYYQKIDFTVSTWWGLRAQQTTQVRFLADAYGPGSSGMVEWRDSWL